MRYYTLKPQFVLRGWSNIKYALLDIECASTNKKVYKLSEQQFEAICLITSGGISPDEKILPDKLRNMTGYAIQEGFIKECDSKKELEEYQKYRYSNARYTHTLLWSVTGNCNLRCRHCYVSAGDNSYGEITFEQCCEVIEQCRKANINTVALTGGEPLVRKDFWKIVDKLHENHIGITQIYTNGMAVNAEFLDKAEKHGIGSVDYMISYDGAGRHDWLRGVKGAEERAVNAIKLLKSRGYNVYVSTSVHMGNIDALYETYRIMKSLKADYWKAAPVVDTGNWKKRNEQKIDHSKIFDEYLEIIKAFRRDNPPMKLSFAGFFYGDGSNTEIPFISGSGSGERCSEGLCTTTRIFPYLLPDGRVLPCIAMSGSEMENIAPNIFNEGEDLEKALSDSLIDTYTKYTYKDLFEHNAECASCGNRYICTGCRANALANGGYFEKDPLACCFFKGGYEKKIREIMQSK